MFVWFCKVRMFFSTVFSTICHCLACKKSTGSAFSPILGILKTDLNIDRTKLKKYESLGDSGNPIYRHFCENCGTTIYGEMSTRPNVVFLKVGTLHDSSWFKPQINTYWEQHSSWINEINEAPKCEGMPKGN